MKLHDWALKWSIPFAALDDLRAMLTAAPTFDPSLTEGKSETAVLNEVKLDASRHHVTLWRNNVGATYTQDGAFIRYGLANESKQMNEIIKSADLIGIRPLLITPLLVGRVIGQFVSREVKASDWKYSNTKREHAQLKWAEFIIAKGGDACFATGYGTF